MAQVYRICLARYAQSLFASGRANRWNSEGKYVIYAAQSRALACLENLVHLSGLSPRANYGVMVIGIEADASTHVIPANTLPEQWHLATNYPLCQRIGDEWYNQQTSLVMVIPSSVIQMESIYVINTQHPQFNAGKVRLLHQENFDFDSRIPWPTN
jgi:RES domain-containing protein